MSFLFLLILKYCPLKVLSFLSLEFLNSQEADSDKSWEEETSLFNLSSISFSYSSSILYYSISSNKLFLKNDEAEDFEV